MSVLGESGIGLCHWMWQPPLELTTLHIQMWVPLQLLHCRKPNLYKHIMTFQQM